MSTHICTICTKKYECMGLFCDCNINTKCPKCADKTVPLTPNGYEITEQKSAMIDSSSNGFNFELIFSEGHLTVLSKNNYSQKILEGFYKQEDFKKLLLSFKFVNFDWVAKGRIALAIWEYYNKNKSIFTYEFTYEQNENYMTSISQQSIPYTIPPPINTYDEVADSIKYDCNNCSGIFSELDMSIVLPGYCNTCAPFAIIKKARKEINQEPEYKPKIEVIKKSKRVFKL